MQVYEIYPDSSYSGGCALVAADDKDAAIRTFCDDKYYEYQYDYLNCKIELIDNLTYDTKKPLIILNTIYSE